MSADKIVHPAPELELACEWSTRVNALFGEKTRHVPPFPYTRESFEFLFKQADLMVVSCMPLKDVEREWSENDLIKNMRRVGAQEMGSKMTQIQRATQNRYSLNHALMIGDAPGDMQAAHDNVALFYPINPGYEEASWKRFFEEGVRKFSMGEYAGRYEASLIEGFNALMPDVPPWDKT